MTNTVTHTVTHTGNTPNVARRAYVAKLYLKGWSARAIGTQLGVSYQAVLALLRRSGIPRRKPGGNTGSHSRHRKA